MLKGTSKNTTLAISQLGGSTSVYSTVPADYALVKVGEPYVLFLKVDTRSNAPTIVGNASYAIVGGWSGLFHFKEGLMTTDGAPADVIQAKYVGKTLQDTINEVTALVAK